MNSKHIDRVLSDNAIHVQNLIEQDDDAQCVILGDVYLLCDKLDEQAARIAELEAGIAELQQEADNARMKAEGY